MGSSLGKLYEFGPFRLDTEERTLRRAGMPVPLTPKAYEVLLTLVRRAGRIVEKDELMREVWADAFVEEGNLTHHIFTLRKALAEREGVEYIETIPRRGYRFVSTVQEVTDEGNEVAENHTRPVQDSVDKTTGRTGTIENANIGTRGFRKVAVAIIAVLLFGLGTLSLYRYFRRKESESRSISNTQQMQVRKLSSNSRATTAAISPDGKYVVYSKEEAGRQSLWLKQVATLSEVQIVPPAEVNYFGSTFTPDGSYLYYVMGEKNGSASVYQISAVGGTPRKILQGINDGPITLSPDGTRFAFVRENQEQSESSLWTANADGGGERKLATRKRSEGFDYGIGVGPAWSPDGRVIACSVGGADAGGGYKASAKRHYTQAQTVVGIDVESGEQKPITSRRWYEGGQLAWRPDGGGLVLVADEQVWQLSYPGGEARKITNDANQYIGISLTADSSALVTVQLDNESSIWVAPSDDVGSAHPVTSGAFEGYRGLSWTPDGKIVYSSMAGGDWDIWSMAADGTARKQLTADEVSEDEPSVSADGRYIVFKSTGHIWRINIDGSDPQQLTNGPGEGWPECSPDGKWVVYASSLPNLWKVPIEGGDPVPVTGMLSSVPTISPDGKLIAFRSQNPADARQKISVMSLEDGRPLKAFDIQPTTIIVGDFKVLRWTPDGGGLAYIDTRTGAANIWSRPLDGGPERQLTDFKSEQIFKFAWSRDGKHLAIARGAMMKDVILISGFE